MRAKRGPRSVAAQLAKVFLGIFRRSATSSVLSHTSSSPMVASVGISRMKNSASQAKPGIEKNGACGTPLRRHLALPAPDGMGKAPEGGAAGWLIGSLGATACGDRAQAMTRAWAFGITAVIDTAKIPELQHRQGLDSVLIESLASRQMKLRIPSVFPKGKGFCQFGPPSWATFRRSMELNVRQIPDCRARRRRGSAPVVLQEPPRRRR